MTPVSLHIDYVSPDGLGAQSEGWWHTVLGVVGFDAPPRVPTAPAPIAASMTPTLGAVGALCEVWRVGGCENAPAGDTRRRGAVHYRCHGDFLFGSIAITERARNGTAAAALVHATTRAYREIFAVLEETGHRHLIRVWNYLAEINGDADGDERYRRFNAARQAAFRSSGRSTVGSVPAACALGSPPGSPLSIYFLASRRVPCMIENPRQTSAYHYPAKFGLHSPTFSRACLLRGLAGTNLFVSGTASIVGHESTHRGDVIAQTRETLANIDALLDETNRMGADRYALGGLRFKVYVRRARDLGAVERALSDLLGSGPQIVYLNADVCREDLLVEIEATGSAA
jgi:enamine deaminase RidA (YjgF/YER057c/UK114 family)